ncbi:AraC family transcriptional regulator [Devosia sp. XK-2]|uniref:AraC family transcriptional regulator n=1 Tax=Devosia sp. XK-2 TaxID=3126689 RepID=UPI0030CE9C5A
MVSDPLSEALALLRPKSWISAGLDAAGPWAMTFGPPDGIKFNAVLRGSCWLRVGEGEPIALSRGDCFLLTQPLPFVLASALDQEPIDAGPIYAAATDGIAQVNGGGDFFLIGGRFSFEEEYARLFFRGLPPVVHTRSDTAQSRVLRWALDQLALEVAAREAGAQLMSNLLAQVMLVQVLRLHLSRSDPHTPGWMKALADRRIGPAVRAMHADLTRRWTVSDLAQEAAMSRSAFAARFMDVVGISPVSYLSRWRMLVASERLKRTDQPIGTIAFAVGYESEAAFSVAFSRIMGRSPRAYRREAANRPSGWSGND